MTNIYKDVNLFYYGASGGFLCLHLLLLTGSYRCKFMGDEQNFENIFAKQWQIKNIEKWKSHETWPDNDATLEADLPNKVFYICNDVDKLSLYPGKLIVLYTDIETQWILSKTKHAYWFVDRTPADLFKEINDNFTEYYDKVKGFDWPGCDNINEFQNLPERIKTECREIWKFDKRWPIDDPTDENLLINYRNNFTTHYKDIPVYDKLKKEIDIDNVDIAIKLQDLIITNGNILFDRLGIDGNSKCKDFIDFWLSKHSAEQLKYLVNH
jgi:hypothetical protein